MNELKKWHNSVETGTLAKCRNLVKDVKQVSDKSRMTGFSLTCLVSQSTLQRLKRTRTQPKAEPSSVSHEYPVIDAIKGPLPLSASSPGIRSLKRREDAVAAASLGQGVHAIHETRPAQPPLYSTIAFPGILFSPNAVPRSNVAETENVGDSEANAERKLAEMDDQLRRHSRQPFRPPGYYLPNDSFHSIMNREAIQQIIPCIARGLAVGEANKLAQAICGLDEKDEKPTKSFRKILAILILVRKANHIHQFVNADIPDAKLPLSRLGNSRPFQLCLTGHEEAIPLFETWDPRDVELFETTQWETSAPFFREELQGGGRVPSYKLTQHPLPFHIIQEGDSSDPSAPVQPIYGSSGHVWKVKIARSHHNLPSYRVRYPLPSLYD